jgi:hypothetical protein
MLLLTNIEGDKYNPVLDNYLVVRVNNYANTAYDELQALLDLVNKSHEELVMVECDRESLDIFTFMEDIAKLVIFKVVQKANNYYLTVQKSLI